MRTTLKFSIAALALTAGVSACGDARATEAAQAELKRDLELASSTINLAGPKVDASLLDAMETAPKAAPAPAAVVKKAPGPKAVRSPTPTVRATPEMEIAAVDESEEVVETESIAPSPEEITEPVAVAPRPEPVVVNTGGSGDYGNGGGGVFGGGIGTGVIIRGGGIDGDNCELHRRGRGTRGPIYVPSVPTTATGGILVNRPRSGTGRIGIGSRPSSGSVTGSRPSRGSVTTSRPSSSSGAVSRGGGTARGAFSPRGR